MTYKLVDSTDHTLKIIFGGKQNGLGLFLFHCSIIIASVPSMGPTKEIRRVRPIKLDTVKAGVNSSWSINRANTMVVVRLLIMGPTA